MQKHGVEVETIRAIDHDVATGVYPDMREHGWEVDEWPEIYKKVQVADILVLAGPIWQGGRLFDHRQRRRRQALCYGHPL